METSGVSGSRAIEFAHLYDLGVLDRGTKSVRNSSSSQIIISVHYVSLGLQLPK